MGGSLSKKEVDDKGKSSQKKSSLFDLPPYSTIAGNRQGFVTRIEENPDDKQKETFSASTNGTPYIYYSTIKSARKQDSNSLYIVKSDSRHKEYKKNLLYIRAGQHLGVLD